MSKQVEMVYVPVFSIIFIEGNKVVGECERTGKLIVIKELRMVH